MKKVRLDLNDLAVDSFETVAPNGSRGTVVGLISCYSVCDTLCASNCWTCVNTCGAGASCLASCPTVDDTCGFPCGMYSGCDRDPTACGGESCGAMICEDPSFGCHPEPWTGGWSCVDDS